MVVVSMLAGRTPCDMVGQDPDADASLAALCVARLQRVEALLCLSWHPYTHIFFPNEFKRGITVFRVGTWFLSRLLDARECARSLSWLLWAWTMPYMGYGWMAPRWLPDAPVAGVEDGDAASDSSASEKRGRDE